MGKKGISITSLGTGSKPPEYYESIKKESGEQSTFKLSAFRSFKNFDWVMNFDSVASDKVLETALKHDSYVRANTPTKQDLDTAT